MRIYKLELKNIGPFREATLDFIPEDDLADKPPVTIITGKNGTGKTIILDALRALMLSNPISWKERSLIRDAANFCLKMTWTPYGKGIETITSNKADINLKTLLTNNNHIPLQFLDYQNFPRQAEVPLWIVDYWSSKLSSDSFEVTSLTSPNFQNFLFNSLSGLHRNVDLTQWICYLDNLRGSEDASERKEGEALFEKLKDIFKLSLQDGEFAHVARRTYTPFVIAKGKLVSLDKLSSGNLYLVQRLALLLQKMYAVYVLRGIPLSEICNVPGLLLIDEAENHLHPEWQKIFIPTILKIFPNLQIIATTHSPFIVASTEKARVYVCESQIDHSIVQDYTDVYFNQPVEEILLSPVFRTQPFNETLSSLILKRKEAIESGNEEVEQATEKELKELNPDFFRYFDVENLLSQIK